MTIKLALYVPWFDSEGPLKSKVSNFFIALDLKFVLALEQISFLG